MATLLENLQARLASSPKPVEPEPEMNLEEILQAKRGKAAIGGGASIGGSNVMSGIANDTAQNELAQQAQQGQVASAEIGGQVAQIDRSQQLGVDKLATQQRVGDADLAAKSQLERTATSTNEALSSQKRFAEEALKTTELSNRATLTLSALAAERSIARDNIFSNAKMENADLAQRKDAASLEQKAFLLAMSDKSYLDQLEKIGVDRNLRDAIAFDKEAHNLTYGHDLAALLQQFEFQSGQNTKERSMKEQLSTLSNGQIIQLADLAAKQANMQALWTSGGKVASAAVDAWMKNDEKKKPSAAGSP